MLKPKYTKKEDIPTGYDNLYTERDGAFVLTGVEGFKSQEDIDRLTVALGKEREEHKTSREKLRAWEGMEPEQVRKDLDRIHELEVAAKENKEEMDKKLEEMAEARVKSRLAPVDRQLKDALKKSEEALQQLTALQTEKTQRIIRDAVRKAALAANVQPSAEDDVLLLADAVFTVAEGGIVLTKENAFGVAPGLTPDVFLTDMQPKRPHWWPASQGGNSHGGDGKNIGGASNPWTAENWNLTEQGRYVRANGMEKAQQLAKLAGTTIGAGKPQAKK